MAILLATVVGWDQRRTEWADVAWLAMCVHVQKVSRGAKGGEGASLTSTGRISTPSAVLRATPPPPPQTQAAPCLKAPYTGIPAKQVARERVGWDVAQWLQQEQQQRLEAWQV